MEDDPNFYFALTMDFVSVYTGPRAVCKGGEWWWGEWWWGEGGGHHGIQPCSQAARNCRIAFLYCVPCRTCYRAG